MGKSEKRHSSKTRLKIDSKFTVAGVILLSLSIVSLLGFLGIGGAIGEFFARLFKGILGSFAWLGPFVTGGFGLYLATNSPQPKLKKPKQRRNRVEVKMPQETSSMSKGTGFQEYFRDQDPLNESKKNSEPYTELAELGDNLPSYFGKDPVRNGMNKNHMVKLGNRFEDYFDDDDPVDDDDQVAMEEHTEPTVSLAKQESQGFKRIINNININTKVPHTQVQESQLDIDDDKEYNPPKDNYENLVVLPEPRQIMGGDAKEIIFGTSAVLQTLRQQESVDLLPEELSLPPIVLLDSPVIRVSQDDDFRHDSEYLERVLDSFGVNVRVTDISQGPTITRYEVQPAPGVKISRIVNLADDIALGLAAKDIRIEAPIPGKSAIGIEVPNKQAYPVKFREVLESIEPNHNSKLEVALGKDIAGKVVVADLTRMPHLLVAGATGSGKSVCINTIIASILYRTQPHEVKFLLIDPKMVELTNYNGIPHLIAPVVTDPKKAATALRWIVNEMETRYELFAAAGVRDVTRYNAVTHDRPPLPYIVILIDELADLMLVAPGEVEESICRLAQMARAAGIHLVVATQRPSVDVITGIIKANIPSRIAFAVSSQIDSRTIIDCNGAEKLLGKGDMLYYPMGMSKPQRVQGCFLSDSEVERVVKHWKSQAKPEYLSMHFEDRGQNSGDDLADDELFAQAAKLFITSGMASVSLLQRRLRVGYTRAARLMDILEQKGVVGGFEGSKPRQVLMSIGEFEEQFGAESQILGQADELR